MLQSVTKFGIFVKLEPEMTLAKGDLLEVFRDGQRIGEIVVDKALAPDKNYPNGSVQCVKSEGAASWKMDRFQQQAVARLYAAPSAPSPHHWPVAGGFWSGAAHRWRGHASH